MFVRGGGGRKWMGAGNLVRGKNRCRVNGLGYRSSGVSGVGTVPVA